MCVFRELSAIGTWTNYAKQMVDQFLNAERESWEYSKFRYLGREVEKVSNVEIFCYFWDSKLLCRGKKREREEKSNLRE